MGVFQEGGQEKLRSDFQRARVVVKVGVVQMGRVNDQMGQSIGTFEEMTF